MNERGIILDYLATLVVNLPEQRVGQIIFNYICANCPNNDPFFITDEKLLEVLKNVVSEVMQNVKND